MAPEEALGELLQVFFIVSLSYSATVLLYISGKSFNK